jgi:hypothetical protein
VTYTVDDIAELVRRHLVLSEDDDDSTAVNLMDLVAAIQAMAVEHGIWPPADVFFCDGCGGLCGRALNLLPHDR